MIDLVKFGNHLDRDLGHRKKEIISFKLLFTNADEDQQALLRHAGVMIIYSHWEGFIKEALKSYVKLYVGLPMNQLPEHMKIACLSDHLWSEQQGENKATKLVVSKIAYEHLKNPSNCIKGTIDRLVISKSNLNFEQVQSLLQLVEYSAQDLHGFNTLSLSENFIDSVLLHTRHSIAHGEMRPINKTDFEEIMNKTLDLLDELKETFLISAQKYLSN